MITTGLILSLKAFIIGVIHDSIFHNKHGYSFSSNNLLTDTIKKLHEKTMGNITGSCKQCGLCCRENWRFKYNVDSMEGVVIPDYQKVMPDGYKVCTQFDTENNTCRVHSDKPGVCKYWPVLESDLEQINCPGYKVKEKWSKK